MNPFRILSIATLLAASAGASAGTFSYDYLEGGFGEIDVTGRNNGDAIYLGGAKTLNSQFGVLGAVGIMDYDGTNGMVLRGGGLFHTPINKQLDFFGTLELVYSSWDAGPGADDNDIGVAAAGGLRYEVQDNFQVEGKLTVVQVDPFDDGLGLSLDARYFLNKQLSAAVGVASQAEFDGLFVNVRYDLK